VTRRSPDRRLVARFVRVRGVDFSGTGPASNEVMVIDGECASPPPPPTSMSAVVRGPRATLSWTPSSSTTSFVLEAGTSPLASDVFVGDVGSSATLAADVAPGAYYVRVRGRNTCGLSGPSPEARFVVAPGAASAPASLVAGVVGRDVTLA
jgi:hypothetical protein